MKAITSEASADITRLLRAWGQGDSAALEHLTPMVYSELPRMARRACVESGSMEAASPRRWFGASQPLLDGRQFLVRTDAQPDQPLTVVQNWTALWKK